MSGFWGWTQVQEVWRQKFRFFFRSQHVQKRSSVATQGRQQNKQKDKTIYIQVRADETQVKIIRTDATREVKRNSTKKDKGSNKQETRNMRNKHFNYIVAIQLEYFGASLALFTAFMLTSTTDTSISSYFTYLA